jgi:choline dehydrogenase-like flavoprotein
MPSSTHYDVIIIGSGAGGGTLAYRLAPSGKRILVLERGDFVAREKDNWSTHAVNVLGKYQTKEQWLDAGAIVQKRVRIGAADDRPMRPASSASARPAAAVSPAWPLTVSSLGHANGLPMHAAIVRTRWARSNRAMAPR